MALDVKALLDTMAVVEIAAEHGAWRQTVWLVDGDPDDHLLFKGQDFCGTAGCFAGWSVLLDGWKPSDNWSLIKGEGEVHVLDTGDLAQDRLGLTDDQRYDLFDGNNDLDDLRDLVDRIVVEAVHNPKQGVR